MPPPIHRAALPLPSPAVAEGQGWEREAATGLLTVKMQQTPVQVNMWPHCEPVSSLPAWHPACWPTGQPLQHAAEGPAEER